MGRRTRRILLATVLLLGSCHGGSDMGVVEVDLYDEPVECDAETQACYAPGAGEETEDGEAPPPVEAEPHRTWVFFSDQTTAHHPRGAYLYFEMVREDDVRAYVEIDVPTREGDADGAVMRYTEYRGDEVVFDADTAHGRVEFAEDLRGTECACADGRLELVFVDAGEDEELETDDDRVRRLSRARFTWEKEFCVVSQMLGMRDDRVDVTVRVVDRCPSTPRPSYDSDPAPRDDSSTHYHADTSGCGGDDYDSGSSSSGGCEGDSSSGGGCEGDSSSGGGCEGDTSGGSGGCSGDTGGGGGCSGDAGGGSCSTTTIAPRGGACPRGGPSGPAAVLASARAQLVLGILLALAWLDRRRRRRASPRLARRA